MLRIRLMYQLLIKSPPQTNRSKRPWMEYLSFKVLLNINLGSDVVLSCCNSFLVLSYGTKQSFSAVINDNSQQILKKYLFPQISRNAHKCYKLERIKGVNVNENLQCLQKVGVTHWSSISSQLHLIDASVQPL